MFKQLLKRFGRCLERLFDYGRIPLPSIVLTLTVGSLLVIFLATTGFTAMKKMSDQSMSNVAGRDGITMDLTVDAQINALQIEDADGNATGNNGFFTLNTFDVGSGNYGAGGASTLTGLTVDVNGSQELVFGAPSGSLSMGVQNFCITGSAATDCSSVTPFGRVTATDLSLNGSTLRLDGSGVGIRADLNLSGSLTGATYLDDDGGPSADNASFILGNISLSSAGTLTGLTLQADGSAGVVVGAPSGDFTVDVTTVCYDSFGLWYNCNSGSNFGGLALNGINLGGSNIQLRGHNDGVTADADISTTVNSIAFTDSDGGSCTACSGNQGRIQFGSGGNGISVNSNGELTGMTLDVDPNQGLVIGMPSGSLNTSVDEIRLGTNTSGSASLGIGTQNLSLDGSTVRVGSN